MNLTARQFLDNNLVLDIRNALRESGMEPELLELEITEMMIMNDMKATIRILQELKQMGVRIAIDNFGTGYSSLSKLRGFPLDTIKIDGSFIQDTVPGVEGKSLGYTVIAEGVESTDHKLLCGEISELHHAQRNFWARYHQLISEFATSLPYQVNSKFRAKSLSSLAASSFLSVRM
ncbi:EAL domain-containing protein [Kineobactrum salinum]|uniref:EAL domain-containing protein n=1 Tax=Kineobactrum salinum TaxID=2708301 RepID=A0A6C0TXJ9_9GAMM|nr:EAL domain-containing protein [Kineobactrum salinum]